MACYRVNVSAILYFGTLTLTRPSCALLIKLPPLAYYFSGLYPDSTLKKNMCFKCLLTKPCNKSSVSTELHVVQACLLKSIIKNVFTNEVWYIITWSNLCKWLFCRITLKCKWSQRRTDEWTPLPLPHLLWALQLGLVLILLPGTTYSE